MSTERLEKFGQSLVNVNRLLSVKYSAPTGNAQGHGVLVYDNGQEVVIPAADCQLLMQQYPDKSVRQ